MCQECGCIETGVITIDGKPQKSKEQSSIKVVSLQENILAENDHFAAHNREHLAQQQAFTLNWIGAPGAGKTALLEALIQDQSLSYPLQVIEGDQETMRDAKRIRTLGISATQINTGSSCHLDAKMIHQALQQITLEEQQFLIIENVGNMVCPTAFDLGEKLKVALFSTPEGDDKPIKYPDLVLCADVLILNKIDLIPYVDFDLKTFLGYVKKLRPTLPIFTTSAKTGEGIATFAKYLNHAMEAS